MIPLELWSYCFRDAGLTELAAAGAAGFSYIYFGPLGSPSTRSPMMLR